MITVALATRGRPSLVTSTVNKMAEVSVLDDTRIVVGFDDDDDPGFAFERIAHPKVIRSVAPREDSLGAKYNRCAAQRPADLYTCATDDCTIATRGWDALLTEVAGKVFPDGIGIIYFGSMKAAGLESGLPSMQAVTRKLVERMGYFCVPYFPFWFHDTWIDEIGHMIGRIVAVASIEVAYPDQSEAKRTRGARDILFWARFFDETRPLRIDIARRIIDDPEFAATAEERAAHHARIPLVCECLKNRNSIIRDANYVPGLEKTVSFDAPDDERTRRIRAAAQAILDALPAATRAA